MAGDRINEAYEGKLGIYMQEASKRRIDWLESNICGDTVLDIGCSQGTLCVLTAQKGIEVVGIDNDKVAIDYAQNMLLKEKRIVQENCTFICDDFLKFDFKEKIFDTVVLGEVLEHLDDPLLFLKKVSELLSLNGVLVVTVPFGINRHPDHKKTYYFLDLYNELNEFFKVCEVTILGKWIGMVAVNKSNENYSTFNVDEAFLHNLEGSFYMIEEEWKKKK